MTEQEDELLSAENLDCAKQLVQEIESGNREAVLQLMGEISSARDYDLFQSVGKLTRNLHDTVCSIGSENELFDSNEFPDARERLNHVIQLTEDSANTTLTIVEDSIPLVQKSGDNAAALSGRWDKLVNREMSLENFKELSNDIKSYLDGAQTLADDLQAELTKVLMAQGFQDLTGQLIKQVIKLVDDVESRLIDLVSQTGGAFENKSGDGAQQDKEKALAGEGPALPSKTEGVVKSQDDVDDLLASLGF